MAIQETLTGVKANLKLNNGIDSQGRAKTVSQSMGTMSVTGWENQKAWNVLEKLVSCLQLTLADFESVKTSTLTEE